MADDILFYIVKRNPNGEPLVDEFLMGQYDQEDKFKIISNVEDGEVVRFSKNIYRFPKIIGDSWLALPRDLMLDLRERITAKWRQVKFTRLFDFPVTQSGFDIYETYIEEQEEACRKQGIGEFDMELQVDSSEESVYQSFAERYQVSNYEPKTQYHEMVVDNSTRVTKLESKEDDAVGYIEPQKGAPYFELPDNSTKRLFSWSVLHRHRVLALTSSCFAIASFEFEFFKPYLEPEFFTTYPITRSNFPAGRA